MTHQLAGTWRRAALLVAGCLALAQGARAATPSARTNQGVVTGTSEGKIDAYLGIPYAAPPLGPLRFRPPQPHAAWKKPLATTAFAPLCPQNTLGQEDCLTLNIWAPQEHRGGLPVLVFFHGGAFQRGGASFPYYNGAALAETGHVVVVTVAYRLGALGFLTSPALDAESPQHVSGNYGLMDQQAALHWVHDNIGQFGGDSGDLAIFGESAGANSVLYHLVSPLSDRLFARAISESPVENGKAETLAAAESGSSAAIIAKVGCSGAADIAACLRDVPAAKLADAGDANPVQDGVLLPRQPIDAFRSGTFNHVPVIIGSNHDEWTAFVWHLGAPPKPPLTEQAYTQQIASFYGGNAQAVLKYPASAYPSPIQALAAARTDSLVSCPVGDARAALAHHVFTYAYELNEPDPARANLLGPNVPGLTYGDYHTADLPYVFGVTAPEGAPVTGKDAALSHKVMGYWRNLASSGNPNHPPFKGAGPTWPVFADKHLLLSLQDTIETLSEGSYATAHHCGFWDSLPAE